eukprot:5565900-Pyramimonas_sp.AAC.1
MECAANQEQVPFYTGAHSDTSAVARPQVHGLPSVVGCISPRLSVRVRVPVTLEQQLYTMWTSRLVT